MKKAAWLSFAESTSWFGSVADLSSRRSLWDGKGKGLAAREVHGHCAARVAMHRDGLFVD